MDVNKGVLISP